MLTLADLRRVSRSRITDAAALVRAGRFDAAIYLCGYAVEVALKARVCRTLGWAEFPETDPEWQRHHRFLKVHELKLLAKWCGYGVELNGPIYNVHWLRVQQWNPEMRYSAVPAASQLEAKQMVRSAVALSTLLNPP